MKLSSIEKFLRLSDEVCNVKATYVNLFRNKEYQYVIDCDLIVKNELIQITIGIPINWPMVLVDIYIKQYMEFPFIPHVNSKGKICTFDLEGILIDKNLCGILLQSIEQAKKIIIDGLDGTNILDFINEFDSYWYELPCAKYAKLNVPDSSDIQVVKYAIKTTKRRSKESYSKYLQRTKNNTMYISQRPQELKKYGVEGVAIKNGIYINIVMDKLLLPPDGRHKITVEYLQNILLHVNTKDFKRIICKIGKDKLIVFRIQQPNGENNFLGFFLENCKISLDDGVCKIKAITQISPVIINRIDKKYLMTRSNDVSNVMKGKNILLVGCGSLGGYIVNELVKAGVEKIMLVDDDRLYEENVFRHFLGLEYVGKYKCVALQEYLERNIPNLKITSLVDRIENAVQEENIDFQCYDMIISAIGNHNVNRWINHYMYANKIEIPVIYAWNEVLGIGNHVAYIKYGNNGCYDCFIGRDEDTMELYDCTSYCHPNQQIVKKVGGCGSSFIPYASTISLKTACMCLNTVKKVFENRYSDNIIISSKGDDYYFKKAGLQVSNKYLNQKSNTVEYSGLLFKNRRCEICGEKNGNKEW